MDQTVHLSNLEKAERQEEKFKQLGQNVNEQWKIKQVAITPVMISDKEATYKSMQEKLRTLKQE